MHLPEYTTLNGGKYQIVRFISQGGFGCTYEGIHCILKTRVCIKEFFVEDLCGRDEKTGVEYTLPQNKRELLESLRHMYIKEARALFTMHHPNIVRVTDIFEDNGTSYYVMDYIDGRSLKQLQDELGPMPEHLALQFIREICSALQHVHNQHRLHLDIKPANIMINDKGHAILIDFGASKHYDEQNDEETSGVHGISTSGYAPVEQTAMRNCKFNPATDIYAVGATLYKLLSGITPPGAVQRAGDEEIMIELPAYISENTRRTVRYCMEINHHNRPQSIAEMLKLLDGEIDRPYNYTEESASESLNNYVYDQQYPNPEQYPYDNNTTDEQDYDYDSGEIDEYEEQYDDEQPKRSNQTLMVIVIVLLGITLGIFCTMLYIHRNRAIRDSHPTEMQTDTIQIQVQSTGTQNYSY